MRPSKLSPQWMRGVRSCFVFRNDHRSNDKLTRDEVAAAVNRLKSKHPTALLTVEDLEFVADMFFAEEDVEPEAYVAVCWYDEEYDTEGESETDIAYVSESYLKKFEVSISNYDFLHGRTLCMEK